MIPVIYKKLLIICSLLAVLVFTACTQRGANQNTNSSAGQTTGTTGQPAPSQTTQNDPVDQPACTNNEDCVLVEESCCPCSGGGQQIAIHRSSVESHNAERQSRCASSSGNSCPTVYLCGQKRAECVNSQCKAIDTSVILP